MDETTDDVKQEGTEEVTQEQPSVPEETTEEVIPETKEEVPAKDESETKEETETVESPKKGAESRIRELNAKAKAAEAKAQSLAQRIEEMTKVQDIPQANLPSFYPEPGSEITTEKYEADVTRQADALITLRLKQQEKISEIKSESQEAVRTYPELDPKSESFNGDLSNVVTKSVEAQLRGNPYNTSVKGLVDELMKPYKRAVAKEVGKASENIAKQVSETALRPNNVKTPNKGAGEKTIEELEKELGVIQA
jgi:hypothetical protein